MRMRRKQNRRGFTLLELMLVMAILVILASLGTVAVLNMRRGADADAAVTQIATLSQQCKAFKLNMGYFPNTLDDLIVQPQGATPQKWRGPYLDISQIPLDSWGNPFTYAADEMNNKVQITSAGPDRQAGTADDISSIR